MSIGENMKRPDVTKYTAGGVVAVADTEVKLPVCLHVRHAKIVTVATVAVRLGIDDAGNEPLGISRQLVYRNGPLERCVAVLLSSVRTLP